MALPNPLQLPKHQVKFYGTYDQDVLVKGVKKFLDDRGYLFHEIYKMKRGGTGWKFEADWTATIKATHFVKKEIKVSFIIQEIKEVEVVIDGKKRKMRHGRGIIEVWGSLQFGYEGLWTKTPKLLSFFLSYIYKPTYWGKWANNHWNEIQDLTALIRQLLKFEVN